MTSAIPNLEVAIRDEIEALHAFFVSWFGGRLPESREAFETDLGARLDTEFTLIQPGGLVLRRDELLAAIRSGHGSNPGFRIAIRGVAVRGVFDTHALVTYEEWQRNAKASEPADHARVASVLFRIDQQRLRWRHVHETWLPRAVMDAGPFDF